MWNDPLLPSVMCAFVCDTCTHVIYLFTIVEISKCIDFLVVYHMV